MTSIKEAEFFDNRNDEVITDSGKIAVIKARHGVFGDYQLEDYHKQNEWKLDIVSVWEGELHLTFERQ